MATGVVTQIQSKPQDPISSVGGRISEHGNQRFTPPVLLFSDQFENTTLETDRWTSTTANSGSVAVAGGHVTLTTSTNTAGSAQIDTDTIEFTPLNGTELLLRAYIRFGTDSDADGNTREIGFQDSAGNNKAYLQLADTTFTAKIDSGGSNTEATTINSPDPDANGFISIEITASKNVVRFTINGVQKASYDITSSSDTTAPLFESTIWQVYLKNTNTGSSDSNTLECSQLGVWMIGDVFSGPSRAVAYNAATDGQLIVGAGFITGVNKAAAAGQTLDVYDSATSATGRYLFRLSTGSGYPGEAFPVWFCHGIYIDHISGAADYYDFMLRGC